MSDITNGSGKPYNGEPIFHQINPEQLNSEYTSSSIQLPDEQEDSVGARRAAAMRYLSGRNSGRMKRPMTVADYEVQRPAEGTPDDWDSIFRICNDWYRASGIVRNIIDLMADFCVAGIQISSPVAAQQTVLRNWANQITDGGGSKGIYFISERIANMLYRLGNVGVRKLHATKTVYNESEWKKTLAKYKIETQIPKEFYEPRSIPAQYVTINPRQIDTPPPEIASFLGKRVYYLKMPGDGFDAFRGSNWSGADPRKYIEMLPDDIRQAIEGRQAILLDNDRFSMLSYKKDDDTKFAFPLIYAALSDLRRYNKFMLLDDNVADSCCDRVVFVKVGDAKQNLIPDEQYQQHLEGIIAESGRGGSKSYVVVPPYLSLEADNGSFANLLGPEKFTVVLQAIYTTFGIPTARS